MTRSTLYRVAVATAIVASTIGCQRKRDMRRFEQRSSTAVPADRSDWGFAGGGEPIGGGPVDVSVARAKIVDARCEREASCGFIAQDQKWASAEACHEVVKAEYSDDLTADDCANGVDAKQLTECIAESRKTDCSQA
ncbi:MAG: DUF6184 family natural product biosynthesis lipoprotein, partial [Polyangiales bacterium]